MYQHLKYILVSSLLSIGCSDSELSVSNEQWKCEKIGNELGRNCEISFNAKNTGSFPYQTSIAIRAHRRGAPGTKGTSNVVVGEKKIELILNSSEEKSFNETFKTIKKPDQIKVSIWGNKV